tara:strand:+ start:525 stop:737 length:213 start_codon:yes stop_codon:yes gene_type:complete
MKVVAYLAEKPVDTMVRSISEGCTDKEIYDFILDSCSLSFDNKSDRQSMADQIAKLRHCDVSAESDLKIS